MMHFLSVAFYIISLIFDIYGYILYRRKDSESIQLRMYSTCCLSVLFSFAALLNGYLVVPIVQFVVVIAVLSKIKHSLWDAVDSMSDCHVWWKTLPLLFSAARSNEYRILPNENQHDKHDFWLKIVASRINN